MKHTQSSVLPTLRGFHYQILLGIEKCFDLNAGQSIWFELDGDISIRSDDLENNLQIESKHYNKADSLTDHHINFWNTLNNWLKNDFSHEKYKFLILHTTQPTSEGSKLYGWNSKMASEKLELIKKIYNERSESDKNKKDPKGSLKIQREIFNNFSDVYILEILEKMLINDSAQDIDQLSSSLQKRLIGIPEVNILAYFEGIVGWVYTNMKEKTWVIDKGNFQEKLEYLTSRYSRGKFSFPLFSGEDATEPELLKHENFLFVKKIKDIEHNDEIPEAVGNFVEFTNILLRESEYSPKYIEITKNYKKKLIRKFKRSYRSIPIKYKNNTKLDCAKILYDSFIDEPAEEIQDCEMTPKPYKNGLIHSSMDDESEQIKWEID